MFGDFHCPGLFKRLKRSIQNIKQKRDAKVKEKKGTEVIRLFYKYPVRKHDNVQWRIENTEDGNICINCEVRRKGSNKINYDNKSKDLPPALKGKLHCKKKCLDMKNGCYRVELEKPKDFDLMPFLQKARPARVGEIHG